MYTLKTKPRNRRTASSILRSLRHRASKKPLVIARTTRPELLAELGGPVGSTGPARDKCTGFSFAHPLISELWPVPAAGRARAFWREVVVGGVCRNEHASRRALACTTPPEAKVVRYHYGDDENKTSGRRRNRPTRRNKKVGKKARERNTKARKKAGAHRNQTNK